MVPTMRKMLSLLNRIARDTERPASWQPFLDNPLHKGLHIDGKRSCKRHKSVYAGTVDVLAALLKLLYRPRLHAGALGKLALA